MNKKEMQKFYKNILSCLLVIIYFLFISGCCFSGSETQINDDGIILWQGLFPHDFNEQDQFERKNTVVVGVKHNEKIFGNLETRNKNLNLVYVDTQGNETKLWKYMDYGAVEKITFSNTEKILRIYYSRAIIGLRNKNYVIELNMETLDKKTILIECGEWNF